MTFELRPYQVAAVDGAKELFRQGHKRIVLSMATGGGKTECAMAILQASIEKGSKVSFVADRRSLVKQTSERFTKSGIRHGILMGNDTIGTLESTRVESAQTILSRGLRQGTDLFVVDESHCVFPALIKLIADSGAYLVGLTATPFPAKMADPIDSHLPIEQQSPDSPPRYEAMVSSVTTDQLIADGYLCPFDVVAPESVVDVEGVKVQSGEFDKKEIGKRIMRIVGDIVSTWEQQLEDRYGGEIQPTVVFGASIDDAEQLQKEFRKRGYPARIVSSREDDDHNQTTINAFRDGEFDILVNCSILSRGTDFPRATILCDAYPMRKMLTPIQRYGRVMRTFPGKERATVIDYGENWISMRDSIMSFYTSGPVWPPPEASNKNARDKKPPRDAICKACRTVMSPEDAVCPACGTPKPVRKFGGQGSKLERVDGVLKVIDSVSGEASIYGGDLWAEVCTEVRRTAGTGERAYKRSLASYRAITGTWPPTRNMQFLDREPDPAVAGLMRRNFQAWLLSKKHGRQQTLV